MTIRKFQELDVWKLAREVCSEIGTLIDAGTFQRNFRLIGQMEGSSGSIMDNIAEGFERGSRAEFVLFLAYAKGSCGELNSQLYRAVDRHYISTQQFDFFQLKLVRISHMLHKLSVYVRKSNIEGSRKK